MFISEDYLYYIRTLPPLQQISQAERLAQDVNYRYRLLFLARNGREPVYYDAKHPFAYDTREWNIEDVLNRQPGPRYNTRTHTQYYYN